MSKEELKLRIFEAIANNVDKMCDSNHYMSAQSVAKNTNSVYNMLFNEESDKNDD